MADGDQFPRIEQAPANGERRGPMRPAQLASPRVRVSGRLLARGFMAADAAFLGLTALAFEAAHGWSRPAALLGAVLAWTFLIAFGAYRLRRREGGWRHLAIAAAAGAVGWATSLAAGWMLQPAAMSTTDVMWAGGVVSGLVGLHWTWFRLVARLRRTGKLTPNVVILGATPAAERLIGWALANSDAMKVIGVFDDRRDRIGPSLLGVPVLGVGADLVDHRILPYVDRVIITVPAAAGDRIVQLAELLVSIPNPIALFLDDAEAAAETAAIERVADFALRQISGGQRSTLQRMAKRALDVMVSGTAILFLAPAMGAIALAIRLDSPGPILFRQTRHGYLNEEFRVFKFRSMRVEAEDAQARRQVSANDDRVTRVGRFIRNTSLDELPQLFNVLRGEMSLVGPRPHAIGMLVAGEEVDRLLRTYAHRHRIKPGLTGWAAVRGSRGPVDTPDAVRQRVEFDLDYIERQSFWFDLRIMLQTLPCLLGDSSAVR